MAEFKMTFLGPMAGSVAQEITVTYRHTQKVKIVNPLIFQEFLPTAYDQRVVRYL